MQCILKEKSAFLHQHNNHTNNNFKEKKKKSSYENKLVLLKAGNLNLLQTDETLQLLKAELLDKEHNNTMNQQDSAHTELSNPTRVCIISSPDDTVKVM